MDLNTDVITEILSLLPVQSLLRFRSVCKSWCDIIDSSFFTKFHLQNQSKNNEDENLFLQFTNVWSTWQLSTLNTDDGIEKSRKGFPALKKFLNNIFIDQYFVAGHVNGLICMYYTFQHVENEGERAQSIAIYNPGLDKINILPVSPICQDWSSTDNWNVGFGFDSVTKDYKVVQLISCSGENTRVEIYSRTRNTWRELVSALDEEFFLHNIGCIKSSKSGSSAHWRAERRTEFGNYNEYVILSFNMQTEVFERIAYPNLQDMEVDVRSSEAFAKDDDSFVLFVYSSDFCRLEVWELESINKERHRWTHVRNVNIVPFTREVKLPWPIALWKRGVVLMKYDFEGINLIFYDYSTEKVTKFIEMPLLNTQILEYKYSLISP